MEIKITELEALLAILFKKVHAIKIDRITIEHDYYWDIDTDAKFNLSHDPKPTVGSLIDDYNSLKLVLEHTNEVSIIDFERLGNLILYIGEQIAKSDKAY